VWTHEGQGGYRMDMAENRYALDRDGRQRLPLPKRIPDQVRRKDLLSREQTASIIGVSPRTVTRYAAAGLMTKYLDDSNPLNHRVVFLRQEAEKMRRFREDADSG
jgi:hypothetical protein